MPNPSEAGRAAMSALPSSPIPRRAQRGGAREFVLATALALVLAGIAVSVVLAPAHAQTERPANTREMVEGIQRMLEARGFDPGPVDGLLGESTIGAIRDYQEAADLPLTGSATMELYRHLERTLSAERPGNSPPALGTVPTGPAGEPATTADEDRPDAEPGTAGQRGGTGTAAREGTNRIVADDSERATGQDNPLTGSTAENDPAATAEAVAAGDNAGIIGTSWTFIDDGGATFTARFGEGGTFQGPGDSRFWEWAPVDGGVRISFDNGMGMRVEREGRFVDEDWLNGSAETSTGKSWAWVAERTAPEAANLPSASSW